MQSDDSRQGLSTWLSVLAVFLLIFSWLTAVFFIYQDRHREEQRALTSTRNLASVLQSMFPEHWRRSKARCTQCEGAKAKLTTKTAIFLEHLSPHV
jgi:hypothetical protein